MSHDNPLIPPREILKTPNSQLPVLLVPAVQANTLKTVFSVNPSGVLMAHTEWLPGVQLKHSVSVHIEDCEGLWLSGCGGSVAEHWRLKPDVT